MKKYQSGLIIEGNSTASALLRLPPISAELGPIKAPGLQVARRVSNFLKGGYAVSSYAELQSAQIILIRAPEASLDGLIEDLCSPELNWEGHSFVLCETWTPTERIVRLRSMGAGIASLVSLPTGSDKTFAVEGDVATVRQIRRILQRTSASAIELRSGTKHLLFAATVLCSAVPVPALLMAQQMLREGGVSGNQLSHVTHAMCAEMLAGFLKGARANWGGTLADSLKSLNGDYWDRLDHTHPELADILKEWVTAGAAVMTSKVTQRPAT